MGKLSRGITFGDHDFYNAAMLHALIDTAIAGSDAFPGTPALYDIVMGDLLTVRAIHVASSPSSPLTNDLAIGSDGNLDYYTGLAWADLSTDSIYLVNGSVNTLTTGNPVTADPASSANCLLWTGSGNCFEPLGISRGVYAPGATASIQIRGLAVVRVSGAAADSHLMIGAQNATALSSTSSVDNRVLAILVNNDIANPLSGFGLAQLVH